MGYDMVIFVAGDRDPEEYYEAARSTGLTWQQFRHVTLLSLHDHDVRPGDLGYRAFQAFDQIYVMTDGTAVQHETLVIYMYRYAFENFQIGYGARAVCLFAIVLVFTVIEVRMFRRTQREAY